ncbi:hypothetical protein K7G98_14815 [Saccharothrix sp. MB29]|nr:hypothetical protein [Saccharothrix sp. MB29]
MDGRGRDGTDVRWWTWAGYRANAARLDAVELTDAAQRVDDASIRLRTDVTVRMWRQR